MAQIKKSINHSREVGQIVSFFSGVAKVVGIPHVFLGETLLDEEKNPVGLVVGFDKKTIDVLFFSEKINLESILLRSHQIFSIPISNNMLGRIIGGRGQALDQLGKLTGQKSPVFKKAPRIIDRTPVNRPFSTGIKIIDTTLPLGKGQRELIIGDRKLGKSTLAVDTILNQKYSPTPVYCIYVIIGQKKQKIDDLVKLLKREGALDYSLIVATSANDSLAEQYLAPLVGCTLGEYFRDQGKDALVIYDNFSQHAKIYRDISLLLERPPGREAYPGDIFSLHAGLLERASQLSPTQGGGSLTALPIVETQEGDITSFIATNLISITDGQIYLEENLFQDGFLPAVNVGLSVSRVGSQAQPSLLKEVVGGIRLAISQHKELEKLTRLETIFSQDAQKKIQRGNIILALLKQEKHTFVSWMEQLVLFYAVEHGYFDGIKESRWNEIEKNILALLRNDFPKITSALQKGIFDKTIKNSIAQLVEKFRNKFISQ